MRRWAPGKMWEGEDAYVVGGGPSLTTFPWELLRRRRTIGCNSAFSLGARIIQICVFGDSNWWLNIGKKMLPAYGGLVVGCTAENHSVPDFQRPPEWLLLMEREETKNGLGRANLGWNGHTGSLAINLALILGARRVFLLGFDMKAPKDRPNWHALRYEASDPRVYENFIRQFEWIARDVPLMFPGQEVVNITDDSDLPHFSKISLADHFGSRGKGKVDGAGAGSRTDDVPGRPVGVR